MKKLFLVSILLLVGCSSLKHSNFEPNVGKRVPAEDPKPDFSNYTSLTDTAHFRIWQIKNDQALSLNDFDNLKQKLDGAYESINKMIGSPDSNIDKFDVLLEGTSFQPGSVPRYPSVDDSGVIHLYKFQGPGSIYLQGLPHEIVHAFRNKIRHLHEVVLADTFRGYGFIEEAFAEYVAETIDPKSVSFTNYGFPREVVAGYWLTTHQEIPLDTLWHHHEINGKCVAQAYPLRTSFFFFLEEKYGQENVFKLAKSDKAISDQILPSIFSKDLITLEAEWKPWAIEHFNNFVDRDKVLNSWLTQTPIKYFPICNPPFIP